MKFRARVTAYRTHKNYIFIDLSDGLDQIQGIINKEDFDSVNLMLGDFVEVSGKKGLSKTKEPSIFIDKFSLLMRPAKYIREYDELKELVRVNSNILRAVRKTMDHEGIFETSSPILSKYSGSSNIDPFEITNYKLGGKLYLRFTMEMQLKKLVAKTQLPVFEIGKVFRNMGESYKHYREYQVIESYIPYHDLDYGIQLVTKLFRDIAGSYINIKSVQVKNVLDLDKNLKFEKSVEDLRAKYSKLTKSLDGPIIIKNPPRELSPLAKPNDDGTANDAELIYKGMSIAHVTLENNDYSTLKSSLESQFKLVKQVRKDASLDKEFLSSMKNGLPLTVGFCIGLDRLTMLCLKKENLKGAIL